MSNPTLIQGDLFFRGGNPWKMAFFRWENDQTSKGKIKYKSSIEVYRDMWGSFSEWCLSQNPTVTFSSLAMKDLDDFYNHRCTKDRQSDLSLRHSLKLMRLIARVLEHHETMVGSRHNSAVDDWLMSRGEIRRADAKESDELPTYLDNDEYENLKRFLQAALPRFGGPPMSWQDVRNRAAMALQLGAGLSPGDVRACKLNGLSYKTEELGVRPWKVRVPGNGNSPERETPIASWAGELLQHWLEVRVHAMVLGDCLFASSSSGTSWSKAGFHLATKHLFELTGIDPKGGSFRLRHTFALWQLKNGTSPEKVAQWLGVEQEAMDKYKRIVEEADHAV